jgi:peptidoglycan/xylan/chitin deacetylase (PgdA/CDA1 family)
MKILALLFGMLTGFGVSAQEKHICFTYDDLPVVGYGVDAESQKAIMEQLTRSLGQNQIPAIGFVNEKKLFRSENSRNELQIALLTEWIDSGLDLGNHTFSHPDYNTTSFPDFTSDLLKGETITRELLVARGTSLEYFRHPFLHVGYTKPKADSLQAFLDDHGYTVAPVTIDNEDYLFALAYKRALDKSDQKLADRIGHDYLGYMEKKVQFYETMSDSLFGRNIRQILLMHASALNAAYTDSLVAMLKKKGYSFISMEDALKDVAYQTPITVYGKWGISWMDKWALSQGKKGSFFSEDPATPEYVKKLAE